MPCSAKLSHLQKRSRSCKGMIYDKRSRMRVFIHCRTNKFMKIMNQLVHYLQRLAAN